MESKDPRALRVEDLQEVWIPKSNGVADIGQAIAHKIPDDPELLREATTRLVSEDSPGKTLIETLRYLRQQTGTWHWARELRALSTFKLEWMPTVTNTGVLDRVLRALGYDKGLRLEDAVRAGDADRIDAALAFLPGQLEADFPHLDRFRRAEDAGTRTAAAGYDPGPDQDGARRACVRRVSPSSPPRGAATVVASFRAS